jgi:hypothetical protein
MTLENSLRAATRREGLRFGLRGVSKTQWRKSMSYFYDSQQQAVQYPQQQWGGFGSAMLNPAISQAYGSQAYGQPQFGQPQFLSGQQFGQPNLNAFGQTTGWPSAWAQSQRQLSQQDVGEVVRQLVPLLPQILAQAQPMQAMGYGYGQPQRLLTQQDVNEVVRQILPIVPQIAAALQGHTPTAAAAMYGGGLGQQNPFAQNPWAQATFASQNLFGQAPFAQPLQQQPFGQQGWPQFQAAFGGTPNWNQVQQQRTLTQTDVNEVVRQLVGIIPQAIANLQTLNQQRVI